MRPPHVGTPVESDHHHEDDGEMGSEQITQQIKRMPTPKEVMKGLNEVRKRE